MREARVSCLQPIQQSGLPSIILKLHQRRRLRSKGLESATSPNIRILISFLVQKSDHILEMLTPIVPRSSFPTQLCCNGGTSGFVRWNSRVDLGELWGEEGRYALASEV
jgi:hypothetical protein